MKLQEFMDGIGLSQADQKTVLSFSLSPEEYTGQKQLFLNHPQAFWDAVNQKGRKEQQMLWLLCFFTRLGADRFEAFQEKGISRQIFFQTLSDISIWAADCRKKNGFPGLSEGNWVAKSLHMELFRLGRLQFEPSFLGEIPCLKVHIPEGGPLAIKEVFASFDQAKDFFHDSFSLFTCSSWLLFPGLQTLLPPESNIIQFQHLFSLKSVDLSSRQGEERIIGKICSDPSLYPSNTSLQKKAREYLLKGGKLGSGFGVRTVEGYNQHNASRR